MRYHSITPVRCNFNPRTPVGCDFAGYVQAVAFQISIHAPQWSATIRRECGWHVMPFQSTHPVRGATWYLLVGSAYSSNFNPRAP